MGITTTFKEMWEWTINLLLFRGVWLIFPYFFNTVMDQGHVTSHVWMLWASRLENGQHNRGNGITPNKYMRDLENWRLKRYFV